MAKSSERSNEAKVKRLKTQYRSKKGNEKLQSKILQKIYTLSGGKVEI